MSEFEIIINKYNKNEITSQESFNQISSITKIGIDFINELIVKEKIYKKQLSENLNLYKEKLLMNEYDKTFSLWNKTNLVIWDLEDILCRMGEEL